MTSLHDSVIHGSIASREDLVDWGTTGPFLSLDDSLTGVEVERGRADVFAVSDRGWHLLGTVEPGAYIIGCKPVDDWHIGVRRAADVVLRRFDFVEDELAPNRAHAGLQACVAGFEHTLANLSLDSIAPRPLPPREFNVLAPGDLQVRRGDSLRPIDSWLWICDCPNVVVHSPSSSTLDTAIHELTWIGVSKNDWVECLKKDVIKVHTSGELIAERNFATAWEHHVRGLLIACREAVQQHRREQHEHIQTGTQTEIDLIRRERRSNLRLASGDGGQYEPGTSIGPWGTAMLRALQCGRQQMRPGHEIRPALRSARSFDEIALLGWVRTRPLKLTEGWWRETHASPFVTHFGPDKVPCTVWFRGRRPWIQLWNDEEERPLEESDLTALDAEAHVVETPLPAGLSTVSGLCRFGLKGSAKDFAALVAAAAVVMALSVATPLLAGQVIGNLAESGSAPVIIQLGGVLLVLVMLTAAVQTIQNHLVLRVKGRFVQRVGSALWARILSLPLSFFESRTPGALGTIVLNLRQAQEVVSGAVVSSMLGLAVAAANLFVLFAVAPMVGVGVGVLVLGATIAVFRIFRKDVEAQRKYLARQQEVSGLTLAVLSAMPKIRAAGCEPRVLSRWGSVQREALRHLVVSRQLEAWVMVCSSVFMPVAIAIVVAVGGTEATGRAGLITALLACQLLATNYIQAISLVQMLAPVIPMFGFLRPILEESPESGAGVAQPGELSGEIRLHEVSFRYGHDGPLVLDKVSLGIKRGEFVAFVGPSGSGKSTLLRILIGFDRPHSGSVIYDGQDLSELDAAAIRRQCGIVLQNNNTVSGSIRDNICGSGSYSDSEVWEAAEMAGISQEIQAMPMKLSTHVSSDLSGLSGGQRQRLMIARALISRPRIVVFDEATSALDNPTQAHVTESVRRLNATRIVVAHRLSTVRDADRIVVMDQGRIVETGTFDELIEQGGLFASMAAAQESEDVAGAYA